MFSYDFPRDTVAFELPDLMEAMELFERLHPKWPGWMETRLDGTFVIVLAPEKAGELNDLLEAVVTWIIERTFIALRFYIEGRSYIVHRGGFIGPVVRENDSLG
jgi:hypothetical protein